MRELAEAMDDRTRRLGEHAAATSRPGHARRSRPSPRRPGRPGRTGSTGPAWSPPTGSGTATPTPTTRSARSRAKTSPEARAAWHAAMDALGQVDGIDLRGCTDGDLWLRRSTYERETAWAPPHVAEELRLMRIAERDAHVNAVRAEHETRAAHDEQAADPAPATRQDLARAGSQGRHGSGACSPPSQDTRRQWEDVTETTRRIAIAADTELRRRHPGLHDRAAPPAPRRGRRHHRSEQSRPVHDDVWIQDTLDGLPDLSANAAPPAVARPDTSSSQTPTASSPSASPLRPPTTRSPSRCCASGRTPRSPRPNSTNWRPLPAQRRGRRPVTRPRLAGPGQGPTAMPCSSRHDQMSSPPPGSCDHH